MYRSVGNIGTIRALRNLRIFPTLSKFVFTVTKWTIGSETRTNPVRGSVVESVETILKISTSYIENQSLPFGALF